MKFTDLKTGATLETKNEKSIKLMQKKPERYQQVAEKEKKTATKSAE